MSEPREFWIVETETAGTMLFENEHDAIMQAGYHAEDGPVHSYHVIEYSAFEAMRKERDKWKSEYDNVCKFATQYEVDIDMWKAKYEISERMRKDDQLRTYDGLTTKLDRYEAALERIAKEYDDDLVYGVASEALEKTGHWNKQEEKKEDTPSGD